MMPNEEITEAGTQAIDRCEVPKAGKGQSDDRVGPEPFSVLSLVLSSLQSIHSNFLLLN
jgi:hypothetical protein